MLKIGSRVLSLWSGINFLISSLILTIVVFHLETHRFWQWCLKNLKSPGLTPELFWLSIV